MRAMSLAEPKGAVELVEREIPDPGAGEIRVRIEASGVCFTDVHLADGDWKEVGGLTKRPVTLGHEGVGIVDAVGAGVDDLAAGDRVGVPFVRSSCGRCRRCLEGRENLCNRATAMGMTHDGCHAEYVIARAAYVVKVPEGLAPEQAAPLCCAGETVYGALARADVRPGDWVAVFGVGGLGHLAVQIARARGARVVATDVDEAKLALARELGADETLDARSPDLAERLAAIAPEVVCVTTIAPEAHELAVAVAAFGGRVLFCAVPGEPVRVSAVLAVFKGITILSQAVGNRQDLVEVFDLAASGKLRCEVELRPLEALPAALDDLRSGRIRGRVVLKP